MYTKPSLRRRIAQHVLVPLVITWAIGTAVMLGIAEHFAGLAFDRSLLDDAYALASHVRAEAQRLSLSMTRQEMNTLLFDQSESMYFSVRRLDGSLVAGRAGLHPAPVPDGRRHEFADADFEGRRVRTVTLHSDLPEPFVVVIAVTTRSRAQLLAQLLAYSALPQMVLLLALAWWLRRRIKDELAPLAKLQDAIERRGPADLAPLPSDAKSGATTRDVERMANSIDALFERLQRSLQAQREFAGNVAHELRTPLAGIRAQAAFALSQSDAHVWREQLEGIAKVEQRASRLVDQLLALARAGEGREGVMLEPIALDALVREVLLRMMPRARAAGVDLGGEGLDQETLVSGDRALIEGLLGNLIDNALRYGSGGGQPRITVAVRNMGAQAELSVTDNGAGLPTQEVEQLRKRWSQGDAARRAGEGAGLGLSIVERYAELLGARFTLTNGEDGGVRAAVFFPD
jgi:two-component system sensor histidine kinase TctE